jgi:hypothetical protein
MHHTGGCSGLVRHPRLDRANAVVMLYGEASAW